MRGPRLGPTVRRRWSELGDSARGHGSDGPGYAVDTQAERGAGGARCSHRRQGRGPARWVPVQLRLPQELPVHVEHVLVRHGGGPHGHWLGPREQPGAAGRRLLHSAQQGQDVRVHVRRRAWRLRRRRRQIKRAPLLLLLTGRCCSNLRGAAAATYGTLLLQLTGLSSAAPHIFPSSVHL